MSRRLVAAAAVLTFVVTAACTSTRGETTTSGSIGPATTPAPTISTTAPTTSAPPPTTSPAAPSTSAPASSSAAPSNSPATPEFTTSCSSLTVRVLKGGAIRGAEIAAMQFVNGGTSACTITGTPTAQLERGGSVVGTRSEPSGAKVQPYTVQPGDYAESVLRDFSSCNAPLSDQLRLRLPTRDGVRGKTTRAPITLRACTLRATPVGEPS